MVPEGEKSITAGRQNSEWYVKGTSTSYPSTKFLAQRRFICPRWTKGKESETKQEIEDGEGKRKKIGGGGVFAPEEQRTAFGWRGDGHSP